MKAARAVALHRRQCISVDTVKRKGGRFAGGWKATSCTPAQSIIRAFDTAARPRLLAKIDTWRCISLHTSNSNDAAARRVINTSARGWTAKGEACPRLGASEETRRKRARAVTRTWRAYLGDFRQLRASGYEYRGISVVLGGSRIFFSFQGCFLPPDLIAAWVFAEFCHLHCLCWIYVYLYLMSCFINYMQLK